MDEVFTDESKNEYITNKLTRIVENADSWLDVREELNEIPTGYDFYRYDDTWGEFYPLEDSDFEEYKEDVYNFMDRMCLFEEEDEDESEHDECVEQAPCDCSDVLDDDNDMSIIGLYTACNNKLQTIRSTGYVTGDTVVMNGNAYYYEKILF